MSEQETAETQVDERGGKRGWGLFVWVFVLVFIVYPLSMGPAMKLFEVGVIPKPVIPFVYKPIISLTRHSPAISNFYHWYFTRIWDIKFD